MSKFCFVLIAVHQILSLPLQPPATSLTSVYVRELNSNDWFLSAAILHNLSSTIRSEHELSCWLSILHFEQNSEPFAIFKLNRFVCGNCLPERIHLFTKHTSLALSVPTSKGIRRIVVAVQAQFCYQHVLKLFLDLAVSTHVKHYHLVSFWRHN